MDARYQKNRLDAAEEEKLCGQIIRAALNHINNNGPEGVANCGAVFFGVDVKAAIRFDSDGVSVVILEEEHGAKASSWASREDVEEWVRHRQGYDDFEDWGDRSWSEKAKYYVEHALDGCLRAPSEYDVKAHRIKLATKKDLTPEPGLTGLAYQKPFLAIREAREIGGSTKKGQSSGKSRRI